MTLSELSVRRPAVAWVAALLILAVGAASLLGLPVREYPDVDPPKVSVTVTYPGASAEVVERDVARPVEDALNGIEGVDLIDSSSRAGFANVTVTFELGRDLDAAAADVRDRVSSVRGEVPEEAEPPVIRKAGGEAQAMMWITLTSDQRDRRALTDVAVRRLVDPLSIVPGVSQVILGGARRYALRVTMDRARMAARDVTALEIAEALRRENLESPGGRLEGETREIVVRADARPEDPAAFRELVLRQDPDGGTVRLGDVADVSLGAESDRSAVWRSGEPAVGLGIVRRSGSNTLAVADAVKAELAALDPLLPDDVVTAISYDQSIFIEGSIREVVKTLFITVGLVVLVVWLSLGSLKAAAAPSATIPAAVVGAFAAMSMLGFSVNTLTLLALVLAIGLVVDDAIVVIENVARRREKGDPPRAAAVRGTAEVFTAVIATTVVLASVLLPIAALTGFVGKLFTEFALTLTAAVLLSSFLALSLGAAIAARTADGAGTGGGRGPAAWMSMGLARLESGYARVVGGLVRAPWLSAIAAVALGASAWGFAQSLPGGLAPTEDRAVFIVPVTAPEGATLSETTAVVRRIEAILEPRMGEDGPIEDVISIVGTGDAGPAKVNEALVIVKLRPWGEREIGQQALVGEVVGPILALPGAEAVAISPASLVPASFGKPIQMAIAADGFDEAYARARIMEDAAREIGGMRGLAVEFDERAPQAVATLDRRLAAELGLSAAEAGETLRLFLGGADLGDFFRDDETYEVRLRGRDDQRRTPEDIGALEVRGPDGATVPLAAVLDTEVIGTSAEYRRVDRRPSVVLSAVPAEGADLAGLLTSLEAEAEARLPAESQITWLGLSRELTRSESGTTAVFGLALAVVYLVLAGLFGSFVQPLAVMLAVPLAVAAALAALWAAGLGLNIFSQIGALLAVGLLAKNAILVVDVANRLRAEGMEIAEATTEAARTRFRPVVMTSIATLLGAVPLALATGPGAESRTVIGVTVLAGVAGATLITLLIVPGLYRLTAPFGAAPGAASRQVDAELAETDGGAGGQSDKSSKARA